VSGSVTALFDGHPVQHGTVRLLNADDREKARETELDDDGSFTFEYVPKDNYVLVVTGARDEPKDAAVRPYADKEIPLAVVNDLEGISLSLSTPAAPRAQAQPQ
jgi:dipeptidyl aminopeptidase/acylaminoacyl peptidase